MKFYPYKKKKGGGGLAMLMGGGGTQCFEVDLTWELDVLAILIAWGGGGGNKRFQPVKKGERARRVLDPLFSHFVATPSL